MRKIIGAGIAVFAVAMLILVTHLGTGGVRADVDPATIDFEGLAEGAIVSSVDCSSGMTCSAATGGSVGVFGNSPAFVPNAAMIFDATCAGGCSGGDDDLNFPPQGNILIISEDLDASDPDDADLVNAFFEFDFSTWGPAAPSATVCVDEITVMDVEGVEGGAKVQLFASAVELPGSPVALPITGDNVLATQAINICGVDFMRVTLNGSGAIDNIKIEFEENGGGEGCTPGFWKNNLAAWGPTGFSPSVLFESASIFDRDAFTGDPSLLDVMNFRGGGLNRLSAHAVAALLNASHPSVDYDLTPAEVIDAWQVAFDDGSKSAMNAQKDIFVGFNELGCDTNS